MKRKSIIAIIIALLAPLALMAQEPSIKVSAKPQVALGEQFRIAFEVNADGKDFKAPSFNGFTLVGGPFNSTSSSVQVVNGSMTRSVSNTYTFVLRADSEGDFTIGSASIKVDGELLQSEPYAIKVVADDSSSASSSSSGQPSSTQAQTNTNDPQVSGQDLFVKVIPSKKSAYVGEPFVLTYKLYTRVSVSQLSVSNIPSYGGFWTKDCDSQTQGSEVVNGIQYTTYEIKKVVLIPQKAGNFTIEPMVVECVAQVLTQRNNQWGNDPFGFFNDPFFSRSYSNVPKTIQTATVNFEAKSLPVQGKPDSFNGAVGDYNFTVSADRDELSTNEAFTLTMTVSGKGNVELVNLPQPVFPPDFEVYDPKITNNVDANGQGMNGTKKAEYLVIPRRAGNFNIPPMEFSYFNPAKGQYNTLSSSGMSLKVNKGAGDDTGDGGLYASNQEGIKYLGSDIRHIKTSTTKLKPVGTHFFASPMYWAILVALLIVFIVAMILVRKRRQFKQDVVLVRNKKATKVAKGRLKNAYKYLKEQDQNHFYEEMSQALWGYISDKLGIERSVLSMETVKEAMIGKGIDEALSNEFVETLNTCEFARFAPGDAAEKMQGLYDRGMDVIMKVEKTI
ncbi:MAG: BatD family protein [Bacteroidales bacterium]|nr:BatD family protein [Bacteroidales bacterium]